LNKQSGLLAGKERKISHQTLLLNQVSRPLFFSPDEADAHQVYDCDQEGEVLGHGV